MGVVNLTCECGKVGRVKVTGNALAAKELDIIVTCNGCGEPQRVTVSVQPQAPADSTTGAMKRPLVHAGSPPAPR